MIRVSLVVGVGGSGKEQPERMRDVAAARRLRSRVDQMRTCFVLGLAVLTSCDLYFRHTAPDAGTIGVDDAPDRSGGAGGGGGGGGGGRGGAAGVDRDPTTGDCLPGPCPPP